MSETILKKVENNVLTITLNRPEKKNAFNAEMIDEWVSALEHAQENDDINVILVTGSK